MSISRSVYVACMFLGLSFACGGEQAPVKAPSVPGTASTTAPATTGTATTAQAGEQPNVWRHDFTKEQAMAFMNARVLPPMTKVFQEYDGKRYAEVTCKTCHGPNYKEPKEYLPKLVFKDGKMTAFAEKPAVSKFMAEKVVPAMAAAMGQPPYDPATHKGFGCGGCHAVEMR
ncbi:MAG: hypothetical protein U0174_26400 [Polyangiaceae bacterium]